jgi:hypothetical protein
VAVPETWSRFRSAALAYRVLPANRQALLYRIALGLAVALVAYVLIEIAWTILQAGHACADCSAKGDPGGLGAAGLGGGAAALGGDDDPPGKSRFDNWLDNALGDGRPPKSVESVDPPAPRDPAAQQAAEDEARKGFEIYKHAVGTEGPIEAEEGSVADELNKAIDRFLDFSTGRTDVGGDGLPPDPQTGSVDGVGNPKP